MTANNPESKTQEKAGFQPFIPAGVAMEEFNFLPLIMGVFLGMVFGASSLYLVLKVGLTVSASIPVAVISVTLFRIFSKLGMRQATILENNIVQTAGSAGESIAFGVGVTMPAILILGFDLEVARVTLVALLGGLLGILMMIPLRRALIVRQHGILKYPEGTACAEVLKAGASEESLAASATGNSRKAVRVDESQGGARIIFAGFGIGLVYKFLMAALKCWKEIPEKIFGAPFRAGTISAEISPELLGVGYIIGPYLGAIMCGGGVLAYLVLIPLIKFFGEGLANPLAPGAKLIRDMAPDEIRSAYILYIGAGAVAAGGIISMMRSLPIIWHSIKEGLNLVDLGKSKTASVSRTELDLSPRFILVGIVVLVTAIVLSPPLHMNIMGALLIVVFGFLFATVSSRLTGEIGSSSNPISGMTVATLLLTCLIFLLLGWTQPNYYLTALSVGGIVCIASSNAGTTSQALKTGHLIGSTPRLQHYAILIGAFGSALILGPLLLKLNQAYTVYVPRVTFEKPVGQPATLPAAEVEKLPVFDAAEKPGPGYRLLTAAAGQPAAGLTNLSAGQYLVNAKGEVALKRLEHFGTAVRAPEKGLVKREKLIGPQAKSDPKEYWVWQKTDTVGGPVGRYLVNDQGQPVYLVDPGINGEFKTRPDGSTVTKLNAPKAVLMSYIIKGILDQKLPWTLMLLGVMIAIVLEMASIPSLAFAVGVYLPLSSSSPIFLGGMIRWLVDLYLKRKHRAANLTAEELQAEGDKSPGVLLASGYIAGGAIAGIFIALMLGVLSEMTNRIEDWSKANNPLFEGPYSDLLSLAPFIVLAVVLYLTGRDLLFRAKPKKPAA